MDCVKYILNDCKIFHNEKKKMLTKIKILKSYAFYILVIKDL